MSEFGNHLVKGVRTMEKSTTALTDELSTRPGVKRLTVEPYQEIKISIGPEETVLTGPAVILINQD